MIEVTKRIPAVKTKAKLKHQSERVLVYETAAILSKLGVEGCLVVCMEPKTL